MGNATAGDLRGNGDYARFWAADTVSLVGAHVTALALKVLVIDVMGASVTALGVVEAARWLPYLLFGLVTGVVVDRVRRLPLLVGADLARAVVLGLVPLLFALDLLALPVPAVLMAVFGALVKALGAPLGFLLDAVSYLVSGVLLLSLRGEEQPVRVERRGPVLRRLRDDLRDGVRWVYRHPVLSPLALTSHVWFLFTAAAGVASTALVLDELGFDAFAFGVTFAVGGLGGVLGASLSTRAGERFGVGVVLVVGRWVTPAGCALFPLAGTGAPGLVVLCAAQFLFFLAIGLDGPVEMGYRQTITPDRLRGRMNATMRSVNRGAVVLGAPLGGLLVDSLGPRPVLWTAVAGLVGQAVWITASKVRTARL
ncbi:MFS transporter [Saccharothrix sp. Mg75]|uniref:MFS transporter n=1 Tax=Saccharothrix sp. Mg75 TaxID=3445357 RepID=UPI003EEC5D2B